MNQATIEPYLFFNGRCEEALAFYQRALGAKVEMMLRYEDSPEPSDMTPPGFGKKIMHASFFVGGSRIMASDGCGEAPPMSGFSLSLSLPTADEAKRAFEALAPNGTIRLPLGQTFWSSCFGMLEDQFGLGWMIGVTPEAPEA